jgi:hypothetical protein
MSELHSSIIALVSLASGIASNHPTMGQCQVNRLRHMGIEQDQINAVIEIARHIRDESSEKTDIAFEEGANLSPNNTTSNCSTSIAGQACC